MSADIELTEYGPAWSGQLAEGLGQEFAASTFVDAARDSFQSGHWKVRAKGKVGTVVFAVPGGETMTVRVRPKVPIRRLLFMLGYSRSGHGWQDDDVRIEADADLVPLVAHLFERQAERALRQGLVQGYRITEESSLVVRGRIREADQIRRRFGVMVPLEVVHDEYTTDTAENRLLRGACERLLRLPGVPEDVRRSLVRLRVRLADITPLRRGEPLPLWWPTRLNARYHDALRLADLVLRGDSVEYRTGDIAVCGFIVNMAKLFEDFVCAALRDALAGRADRCTLQDVQYLDEDSQVRLKPDFVAYSADGSPAVVADAKYKVEKPSGFPYADLYQMLAYCTSLQLADGHLIYAKGSAVERVHELRNTPIRIYQHALDLDQHPQALLADVQALGERLLPK